MILDNTALTTLSRYKIGTQIYEYFLRFFLASNINVSGKILMVVELDNNGGSLYLLLSFMFGKFKKKNQRRKAVNDLIFQMTKFG